MTTTPTTTPQPASGTRGRTRQRLTIVGVAVVVVLFAIAAVLGQNSKPAPKPPSSNIGTQVNTALPTNIAQLPLIDETGRPTNLAAFQGKIVVLTDFMTLCQEVCPITTAQLNQVDKAVTKAGLADKVQFVEITVDPKRDTPDQLHAYRAFANLPSNFSLLTGTSENLATLWKYLGVGYDTVKEDDPPGIDWRTGKPLTFDIQHTDALIYLDQAGHERFTIVGMPLGTDANLTAGEQSFLNDQGRTNLKNTDEATWDQPQALQVVSWLTKKHISPVG
ncbi:MAG: SCO family protein [Acidothermaceae bacterium]